MGGSDGSDSQSLQPADGDEAALHVLHPIPTFRKAIDMFKSRFGTASVHPEVSGDVASDDRLAVTATASQPAGVTVPAFSASQMEAAKSVQHISMLAYSMQV